MTARVRLWLAISDAIELVVDGLHRVGLRRASWRVEDVRLWAVLRAARAVEYPPIDEESERGSQSVIRVER